MEIVISRLNMSSKSITYVHMHKLGSMDHSRDLKGSCKQIRWKRTYFRPSWIVFMKVGPNSGGAFQHLIKWIWIMMAEDKKWKCDSTKTIPKISFRTRLSPVEAVSWTKFIKHLRILNWRCLATKYFIPNLVEICSENDSVLTKELNLIHGKFKHQNADQKFTLVSLFCNKEYNFVEKPTTMCIWLSF